MPLSNEAHYGVLPMSEAINRIPSVPTLIDELGIFKKTMLTTTYVNVENKGGALTLVDAVPRGTAGMPVSEQRGKTRTFSCLHLPKNDVVRADDVQNVRSFGSTNSSETVAQKVADKLLAMKSDIDYTIEHLRLGALKGKLLNADGTELVDIYKEFGITRPQHTLKLTGKDAHVGKELDTLLSDIRQKRLGEMVRGWAVLCGMEFMQKLIYHPSMQEIYLRFKEAQVYRDGQTNVAFEHMGIKFIQYDHKFGNSQSNIADNEGILLPLGTSTTFREFYAPADMNATVNTKALEYYASREKLPHDKGWSLHAQANPLPMLLRPELVATLTLS